MFTKILFLYSLTNVGDVGHANTVYESFSSKIQPLTRYELNNNGNTEELISKFKEIKTEFGKEAEFGKENYVIFAVGEKGAEALKTLGDAGLIDVHNTYTGLGIHQYFDVISELPLDYISIPEVTVDSPEKESVINSIKKHTLTFSVPTVNPKPEALKKSYEEWSVPDRPALDKKYIVVMLPGDAPDNTGKIRHFTEDSANRLFDAIELLWKQNPDHTVIVENGPRTGKFNPDNEEISCSHEYKKGEDPSVAVDLVSKHFTGLLEEKNIPHQFFNFTFEIDEGSKKAQSVFNQLLYLAQSDAENFFIIPGESVSMLGQIPLYISSDKAIVFKPSSMNPDHEKILTAAFARNFVSLFFDDGSIIYPETAAKRESDDSDQITTDLIEGYNEKFLSGDLGHSDVLGESNNPGFSDLL